MSKKHRCRAPNVWKGEFVYKYGRIDTPERLGWLEEIILKNTVYIPIPKELNDPLEARPKVARKSLAKTNEALFELFARNQPGLSPEEYAHHRRTIDFNNRRFGIDWVLKSIEETLTPKLELQRIYSLSKRPNNLHLWKEYAARHKGYCLEFRHAGDFKEAKEVRYQERFELALSGYPDLTIAFYFYKTPKWQREEELRIVGRRSLVGHISFDPSLLTRIILGSKISAEHQELIRRWAGERKPQLAVSCASEMELH